MIEARRSRLLFALLVLVLSLSARIAHAAEDLAFRRAAYLQRGVNLSNWFASTSDFSQQHAETYVTPADLRLIHDAGMTFVRIGIDPAALLHDGLKSTEAATQMSRIDLGVNEAFQAGLAVEICLFPNDEFKRQLDTQMGVDKFVMTWRFLAQHYAARDPDRLFLELLNEPELNDAYRWMGIQATLVDAIRKVDTAHTIVATAARYSGLEDLLRIQPLRDGNVIYNFHFYEPFPFTHQGATWGSSEWNYFHDVPYPATAESLRAALGSVPDDPARYILFLYGSAGWNRQTLLGRLQFARDWADEHRVPIICDEFGAYRDKAPADSRARYIHDVRVDLEELHIGWAMWDYRGDFGLVTHVGTISVPDRAIFDSLGLQPTR